MMQVPGKWLGLLLHHVLFPTWGRAGTGWAQPVRTGLLLRGQVPVVWESIACCSSASIFGLRCVSPSVIDVSPQDLTHRSPAAGLAAAGRAQRSTCCSEPNQGWTSSELLLFFGESRGWDPTCFLSSVNHVSLLSWFTSVCFSVAVWEEILERRNTGPASFMPLMSLYLSQSSYSITRQTLYSQEQKNEKALFSAAGGVIPCCQSLLYCRSWICSFLDSSTEGVVGTSVLTGTIMLLLKPVKKKAKQTKKKNPTSPSINSIHKPVFSSSQRWEKAR